MKIKYAGVALVCVKVSDSADIRAVDGVDEIAIVETKYGTNARAPAGTLVRVVYAALPVPSTMSFIVIGSVRDFVASVWSM